MLIVQICDFHDNGDARYRVHDPSRYLGRVPGVVAVDCHFYHRHLPALADAADVLVMQFVNDWDLLSLCERRRAAGRITVFEANDYFFDLQPWSPIAAGLRDRTVQELFLQLLASADGVQTSSEELARRWRQRGVRTVAVFPNQLTEISPLRPEQYRPLTIGWGGSPGHFADWYQIVPPLQRWLDLHPEVHLAVMTDELARPFFQLPPERYHFTQFGSLIDYLRFLRSLDIGLAPLLPTDYNRCRSDVKFLEYASQGVAGIYADLEPYQATVIPNETGLLYRTPEQLIESLERLRANGTFRQKLRQQAHAYVQQHRVLADQIGQRVAWYQSLLGNVPRAGALSDEIVGDAVCDGGYLQLHAAEPENTLMDALKKPAPGQATPILAQLLQKHPDYLVVLQSHGKLLNDQRDHRAALTCLERARDLRPDSARTWNEIGRTWFLLDEPDQARAALEEAIRVNPHYLPAWQYLLCLLSLGKSPDGPHWAERAEKMFPECYPLALLGAQTLPTSQIVPTLLRLLNRHAPGIKFNERPIATAAFRQAILAAVREATSTPDVVALLARACEVFPESTALATELAAALLRSGQPDSAYAQYARASALRRQATLHREEFPQEQTTPYTWQFAEHIHSVMGMDTRTDDKTQDHDA
jgi:tetratricopeptide (TPR) repeat protein